ncbi:MAG TPA: NAD(P)H-dependent glycerol-3-phosphate dehydrogenase [Candidatus Omnitrophota bacterium]|nr:NAD(P)H-dependent glycerol-3-phosphate dehydrogenase [Candidatus Omnitrophota bacterium]
MSKVTVIGDGGWGTALALLLNSKGVRTSLWSYSREYALFLDRDRENVKFLKGIKIPKGIIITSDMNIVDDCDFVVFAVPCEHIRSVADRFRSTGIKKIVSAAKGIEDKTFKCPSSILAEYFPKSHIAALSGPSISHEVALNLPTTVVLAGKGDWRNDVQNLLSTETFRVYTSEDVTGVELGGALKNVIAIAAGISDSLGFGTNAKAALLTRGLAEITRLGVAMGADARTFSGLSGLGDLATTCMSALSRNRWFGEEIGKGKSVSEVLAATEMAVEGMRTCRSAYHLAKEHKVEMPITAKVYEIIYEGKEPRGAVRELMTRELKKEH